MTPGNVHNLGLPFVLQNQSGFNFWDIKSGDYFIELEGQHYGWDSSTVQVTTMGPGHGPPMHTHPVEEIFVLVEGEAGLAALKSVKNHDPHLLPFEIADSVGAEHDCKGPALHIPALAFRFNPLGDVVRYLGRHSFLLV